MRYYKIQEGSKKVNGLPIKVNLNTRLEDRIKSLYSSLDCKLIKFQNNTAEYIINLNNDVIGHRKLVGVRLSKKGDLTLYKVPKNCKIYLSEITKKEAMNLKDGEKEWKMTQDYCDANLS